MADNQKQVIPRPSIKQIQKRIIELQSPFSQLDMGLFSGAPKAAVLLPLILKDDDIYIMLTQRSDRMTHHKSTVALPGGMEDPEDRDSIDTALREAEEEIGLPRHLVTVLGSITHITAHPGTLVTPIVGIIPDYFIPVPNEQEVAHVFTVPLSRFLSTYNHRVNETTYHKIPIYIHYFDDVVDGKTFTTWGATAWICIQAAMVIYQQDPDYDFEPTKTNEPTKTKDIHGFLSKLVQNRLKNSKM